MIKSFDNLDDILDSKNTTVHALYLKDGFEDAVEIRIENVDNETADYVYDNGLTALLIDNDDGSTSIILEIVEIRLSGQPLGEALKTVVKLHKPED